MPNPSKTLVIVDPSSTEFNRGSFCYSPYLLHNGYSEAGWDVTLLETFQPEALDDLPFDLMVKSDAVVVTLWSYPQIETAILLGEAIPFETGRDNVYFAGYSPLIDHLGLRHVREFHPEKVDPLSIPTFLHGALRSYPKHYDGFDRLLLSDCDMHIKEMEDDELVRPLFASYGCPVGCGFCAVTPNCGKARLELPVDQVAEMLDGCNDKGYNHIHFTDEDFFFNPPRALKILEHIVAKGYKFRIISLSSARKLKYFIEHYGAEVLKESGMEVIEIGMETGDEDLVKDMSKAKSASVCQELAELQRAGDGFRIFWLLLTFFPGETISSLNATGRFMLRYGYRMDEVIGRIRTNSTKGGLGQFFQPYHGVPVYDDLQDNGVWLTQRPTRLFPSYIPHSFLDSRIKAFHEEKIEDAKPWLQMYNVWERVEEMMPFKEGDQIREYMDLPVYQQAKRAIAFAVMARMGVIT